MKKVISTIFVVGAIVFQLSAQNGAAINSTGAAADPSAMLDISSQTKGMLTPRMTESERTAIASPARGLLIYQIDNDYGFWFFDGNSWLKANAGDNLGNHTATDSLDMSNHKISNLATCTQNLDAANKEYVDNVVSAGGGSSTKPSMISNESASAYEYSDAVQYCENLTEGGYNDWRMPDAYEIQYFSGITGATSNYLWTKSHSPIDYQANQNFISVKLDDGRWRNGDEMVSPVFSEVSGSAGMTGSPSWVYLNSIIPATAGNWLKVTEIKLQVRYGRVRAKFNFPNGTSTYTPTYSYTSSTTTVVMQWSNIQMPILVTSIDLEGISTSTSSSQYGYLTVTGFEIAPLQKDGATLYCRCVR